MVWGGWEVFLLLFCLSRVYPLHLHLLIVSQPGAGPWKLSQEPGTGPALQEPSVQRKGEKSAA